MHDSNRGVFRRVVTINISLDSFHVENNLMTILETPNFIAPTRSYINRYVK